ncbi:MAG TPA: saccharopine dehydrogenase NADP-binding domain-containing protein, partial [Solirubrobacteraceae bacterium]|nr:saccharopine dehydrogenase NADP-binding domain-containing protein [Solirubrobacteraceae bacterium]
MIAVYGATGYTGKLVARELRRRGLSAVLSGRNRSKLKAVVADVGAAWEIRPAAVDDPRALRAAFAGADVVINCAGPFTFYGAPVIEAALDAGAHYVDTTGEQPYMQKVFQHLDGRAKNAGKAVVPAVGFDYLPGDLICALTAAGHEPLRELVVGYALTGFGATRGTMHSALEMMKGGDEEYAGGRWRTAGRAPLRESFDFGGATGRQPVARYPGGEVVTVPRHVRTQAVRERI